MVCCHRHQYRERLSRSIRKSCMHHNIMLICILKPQASNRMCCAHLAAYIRNHHNVHKCRTKRKPTHVMFDLSYSQKLLKGFYYQKLKLDPQKGGRGRGGGGERETYGNHTFLYFAIGLDKGDKHPASCWFMLVGSDNYYNNSIQKKLTNI